MSAAVVKRDARGKITGVEFPDGHPLAEPLAKAVSSIEAAAQQMEDATLLKIADDTFNTRPALAAILACLAAGVIAKRFDNELPDGLVAMADFGNGIVVRVVSRGGGWTVDGAPIDVAGAQLEPLSAQRIDSPVRDPNPERVEAERAWAAALVPPPARVSPDHGERPTRLALPARVSKADLIAKYSAWAFDHVGVNTWTHPRSGGAR